MCWCCCVIRHLLTRRGRFKILLVFHVFVFVFGYVFQKPRVFTWRWIREWCIAWWHSGREEEPDDYEDIPSDMGYATPVSVETPLQSSVSRCTSMNMIRDPYSMGQTPPARAHQPVPVGVGALSMHYDSRSLPPNNRLHSRSISNDSVSIRQTHFGRALAKKEKKRRQIKNKKEFLAIVRCALEKWSLSRYLPPGNKLTLAHVLITEKMFLFGTTERIMEYGP